MARDAGSNDAKTKDTATKPSADKPTATRAKRVKRGRVTPAGTGRPQPSGRYTPPVPKAVKTSPRWVPVIMLTLLVVGSLVIILNYLLVLPSSPSNTYLLVGLGLITAGFITATQWH